MKALDKELLETECIKDGNWVKLVSVLKSQFNEWAMARILKTGFSDFKMVYMPVLMNITPEGINNNELASHARVTKQAMSKVVKELQKLGYVKSKPDRRDKRSTIFSLTDRGKKLVIQARYCVKDLSAEYESNVGKAEFEKATKVLIKLIAYNDKTFFGRS